MNALRAIEPALRRLFRLFRLDADASQEVLQETALAGLTSGQEVSDWRAWLYVTARNRCVVYCRGRRRRERFELNGAVEAIERPEPPPQESLCMERDFRAALGGLRPMHREMVIARLEGRTSTEIAAMSGYAPQSVRRILLRAIEHMKRYIDARSYTSILDGRPKRERSLLEKDRSLTSLSLREARDLLIASLHDAGLGPRALSRLRVEDISGSWVLVGQRVYPLESEVAEELRAWITRIRPRAGFLFTGPGPRSKPITAARVGQIIRHQADKTARSEK